MIRAVWFVIKVAVLAVAAVWIASLPGTIHIEWLENAVTNTLDVSLGFFLFCVFLTILVTLILTGVFQAIAGLPGRAVNFRNTRLQRRGHRAVLKGLSAVAIGDGPTASRHASEARDLLPADYGVPFLLEAQAAHLEKDHARERDAYVTLLEDRDSAFIGLKGLMQVSMAVGDFDQALSYARRAARMHPKQPWVLKTLYTIEVRMRDWDEAERTLARIERSRAVSPEQARGDRIAMLLHQADLDLNEGLRHEALYKMKKAYGLDPSFTPAALRLANFYIQDGKARQAVKTVERTWKLSPHPELVPIWDVLAPRNKPSDLTVRIRWYEKLLALRPDSAEGQMAVARVAMDEGLWGEAKAYLAQADRLEPSARLYKMRAELEQKSGGSQEAIRAWLEKAADAPAGKVWTCRETGRIYDRWSAIAQPHGAFNTIVWDYPQRFNLQSAANDSGDEHDLLVNMNT